VSKFIFLYLIPVLSGIYTSHIGLSVFDVKTLIPAVGIISLVCFISVSIYMSFFWHHKEGE